MNIIDSINRIFDITNETSATILVTIIVFLIGGIITFLYSAVVKYIQRRDLRIIFREMLKQIIKDTKKAEKNLWEFYPCFSMEKNRKPFLYIHITHLYSISDLGVKACYSAFEFWIKTRTNKKNRRKAFHRIFSCLDTLRKFESMQLSDLEKFRENFHQAELEFDRSLFKLQDYLEELNYGKFAQLAKTHPRGKVYLDRMQKIVYNMNDTHRTNYDYMIVYIIPFLKLNKEIRDFDFIPKIDSLLYTCKRNYDEMHLLINLYFQIYKNQYLIHRHTRRVLQVCLKALS